MFLISGLMFSTYYFQDFYSGLKDLVENQYGFTSEQFGRIIGLTTIANVFGMIIVGGIILDKFGIRLAGLIFGGIAALGGLVTYLAATGAIFSAESGLFQTLNGLIFGRILFGIGLEVCCVIVMRTLVKWFKGYELALAMGINMGFGRLGSALAIAISLDVAGGPFQQGGTLAPAAAFAASLIGIAMIMFLVYIFLDLKIDRQLAAAKALEEQSAPEEDFKFSDLVKLVKNSSFVYITLLCVAFYSAVFPFIMYAPDMLVNKFGFNYALPEVAIQTAFGSEALFNAMVYVIVFIFALAVTLVPNNLQNANSKIISRVIIVGVFVIIVYLNREFL
jgi:MFS family permease